MSRKIRIVLLAIGSLGVVIMVLKTNLLSTKIDLGSTFSELDTEIKDINWKQDAAANGGSANYKQDKSKSSLLQWKQYEENLQNAPKREILTPGVTDPVGRNLETHPHVTQFKGNGNSSLDNCEFRTELFENNKRKELLLITKQNIHCFKELLDWRKQPPIKFLSNYKNPCWYGSQENSLFNDNDLHCLPYFFLVGAKKSGTSDIYKRIRNHPEYCGQGLKETEWFANMRYGIPTGSQQENAIKYAFMKGQDNMKVQFYSALYDKAVPCIRSAVSYPTYNKTVPYHKKIIGDASPSTFHLHTNWEILPGNEGLSEPRYTNFHIIKHLVPDAKIIVILRDPVTRLYSDFFLSLRMRLINTSNPPLFFDQQVNMVIKAYNECFEVHSLRECVYNNTLRINLRETCCFLAQGFGAGFYSIYLEDLFSVFGREKVLILPTTDYSKNMSTTMATVFDFLEMKPLSTKEMESTILRLRIDRSGSPGHYAPMLPETRDKLYDFYQSWNKRLAQLLKDDKYLFQER